jgi:hypothetical protein
MADKYIKQNAGALTEVEGTVTSTGAPDAGKIPALDAAGKIDSTLLPASNAEDTIAVVVEEASGLSAGDAVNIFDNGGTPKVRLADASNGRAANGFVKSAYADAATATVYKEGTNDQLTGQTAGTVLFLSATTPGAVTATAPTTAGYIVQRLGVAFSATELDWEPAQPITLA